MSAAKITSSTRKLANWAAVRDLDARAKKLAAETGVPLVEAYPKAFATLQQEDWDQSRPTRLAEQEQR